jgi:hypothetical protein
MKIPSRTNVMYQLCERMYKNGAMSREKMISFFIAKNFQTTHALEFISKMQTNGLIERIWSQYYLTPKMREHLELSMPIHDRVEVKVETSQPSTFKPLSSKYFLSLEARRSDALAPREITFKTSGTSFSPSRTGEK